MGGKWDYGLQLHGVHHTQELLAQLEFWDIVTTGPRRCPEYASKYFFRPLLATLRCRVWTRGLDEIGEGRERKKIYHRGHGDWSTECTESYCAALQSAAVAGVGNTEGTQRGTVLGAIGGHGSLQKERLDLGLFGEPRGGETHF